MLEVENVRVSYGAVAALRGVTLAVPESGIVALLGANGAGKSTLLKAISGVTPVTDGHIRFKGLDVTGLDASRIVRAGIVHCPEGRQVFPNLSIRDNLRLGAYAHNETPNLAAPFALFPILERRSEQLAGTLSGGEQQMLAIARALMGRPQLLLLDEPSLGLAPIIVAQIFEVITDLRARGMAILLVEQNAALALRLADHAYVLGRGSIRFEGPAAEVAASEALREAYLG